MLPSTSTFSREFLRLIHLERGIHGCSSAARLSEDRSTHVASTATINATAQVTLADMGFDDWSRTWRPMQNGRMSTTCRRRIVQSFHFILSCVYSYLLLSSQQAQMWKKPPILAIPWLQPVQLTWSCVLGQIMHGESGGLKSARLPWILLALVARGRHNIRQSGVLGPCWSTAWALPIVVLGSGDAADAMVGTECFARPLCCVTLLLHDVLSSIETRRNHWGRSSMTFSLGPPHTIRWHRKLDIFELLQCWRFVACKSAGRKGIAA